jgi:hypothetical protein
MHYNLSEMDASHPPPYSDSNIDSRRDEDAWDEIVDEDFSDNEEEFSMSCSEDNEVVLLPAALPAPLRRVWEILADRLAESSFEARLVDPEQRKLNQAATKKRYQLDPTKRHTWTSKCGRHQVVGYFNLYAHGRVGLFTEEGFPVYVRLDELSAKDVRFVVDRLGVPLRDRVEAQLSAKQSVEQTKLLNDSKGNQKVQGSSATIPEQEATNERLQCLPHEKCRDWRDRLDEEAADRVPKSGEVAEKERRGGRLYNKNTHAQPLKSHTAFDGTSTSEEAVLKGKAADAKWEARPPAPIPPPPPPPAAAAQALASDGPVALNAPNPDGRLGPVRPESRQTGPGNNSRILGPAPQFTEHPSILLQERHRLEESRRVEYVRRGILQEEKSDCRNTKACCGGQSKDRIGNWSMFEAGWHI